MHRAAVLSKAHQLADPPNPCRDSRVKELLAKTRRAYAKRGALPKKKNALTQTPMMAALATCDGSLRGLRDRSLQLFAWSSGGRRRSEVADADLSRLNLTEDGDFTYDLTYSKTNQGGHHRPENYKPVVGEAAQALRAWLNAAQITIGPAVSPDPPQRADRAELVGGSRLRHRARTLRDGGPFGRLFGAFTAQRLRHRRNRARRFARGHHGADGPSQRPDGPGLCPHRLTGSKHPRPRSVERSNTTRVTCAAEGSPAWGAPCQGGFCAIPHTPRDVTRWCRKRASPCRASRHCWWWCALRNVSWPPSAGWGGGLR